MLESNFNLNNVLDILFLLIVIAICYFIGYYIYHLIDSYGVEERLGVGDVLKKKFIEKHTTYVPITVNNITTMTAVFHDDDWLVYVKYGNESDSLSVSKKLYDKLSKNDKVHISFCRGRISNSFYIKDIYDKCEEIV